MLRAHLALLCLAAPAHAAAPGAVSGTVRVLDAGGAPSTSPVVVFLEGPLATQVKESTATPSIRQKNLRFEPEVNVVTVGGSIDFPNDDMVFHNVFSLSRVSPFDLGLYRAGDSRSVTFNHPGIVDIYCNIHPEMVAKVRVVETALHAVTSPDGRFRISGVPPGAHTVVAWHPYGGEARAPVTVNAGGEVSVTLEVKAGDKPRQHLRKDGTPYGRYR